MTDTRHDIERMILALYHAKTERREASAKQLGQSDHPQARLALLAVLRDADNWELAHTVAEALAHSADRTLLPQALLLLQHPNPLAREYVIEPIAAWGGEAAIPHVLPMLADEVRAVGLAALQALHRHRSAFVEALATADLSLQQAAIPRLVDALFDCYLWLPSTLRKALVRIGTPSVTEALGERIRRGGTGCFGYVAQVWVGIYGAAAFEHLLPFLDAEQPYAKAMAVKGICLLRDQRGIPYLLPLLDLPVAWLQLLVIQALGGLGAASAVPAIVQYLNEPHRPASSRSVLRALTRIGTPDALAAVQAWRAAHPDQPPFDPVALLSDLRSADPQRLDAAINGAANRSKMLDLLEEPMLSAMLDLVQGADASIRLRAIHVLRLQPDNPAIQAAIVAALHDPDPSVQAKAVQAVCARSTLLIRAFPILLQLLDDLDEGPLAQEVLLSISVSQQPVDVGRVARFASVYPTRVAQILSTLSDPAAVEPLLVVLASDLYPTLAGDVLAALGRLGDKRAIPAIRPYLQHKWPSIRAVALQSLGQLGDTESWDVVVAALSDEESAVRLAAMAALGSIGDERAVADLEPLLHDSHFAVPIGAAHALRAIGTPEALAAVERWTKEQNT